MTVPVFADGDVGGNGGDVYVTTLSPPSQIETFPNENIFLKGETNWGKLTFCEWYLAKLILFAHERNVSPYLYCHSVSLFIQTCKSRNVVLSHWTSTQRDRLEKLSVLAHNSKYSPNQSGLFFWCQIILSYSHHRQTNMTDCIVWPKIVPLDFMGEISLTVILLMGYCTVM